MGPSTETLSIRLSREEMEDLDCIAKALDRSKGWILREGLKSQKALLADLRIAQERQDDGTEWIHRRGDEAAPWLGGLGQGHPGSPPC
ncbi:ribbon-helix-helix protein, CopG family [bacterium]|nr:ribbon-helix-helix protein, CopG family [bacterium]